MCLRPDIVYVVSRPVFEGYSALLEEGHIPCTNGFSWACGEHEQAARQADDPGQVSHWQLVYDFALRYGCNRLAALELDGRRFREIEIPWNVPESALTRVVIGDPNNQPPGE